MIRPFNAVFCCILAVLILILIIASIVLNNKSIETRKKVLVIASVLTLIGFIVYKIALSQDPEFDGFSILLPRMLGYYGTHFLIVIEGLAVATFGLYKPKIRDLPKIVLTILIIAFVAFMINMVMRWTGLYPNANYFYTVETEGNFVLELFHSFLPYPFLYVLPCLLILVPYMLVVTLGFYIGDRIKAGKRKLNQHSGADRVQVRFFLHLRRFKGCPHGKIGVK